jgi:hypothetical protein
MIRSKLHVHFGLALLPMALAATVASAASSFSNSLTGFTGNSTQTATQNALATAGFNFSSTDGFLDPPPGNMTTDATVNFDASGAHFGDLLGGNGGRNYVRTNGTDYANVSFVAEVTFSAPDIDNQDIYFGLGAGTTNPNFFWTPDAFAPLASVMYWGETDITAPTVTTLVNNNGAGSFVNTPAPTLTNGTHRVRFAYDWFRKTADISFDFNYAGGPFVADMAAPTVNTLSLYGADGWPTEPARIFFGGGEQGGVAAGIVIKDFQVTVSTPSMLLGDLNSDGVITAADWAILRAHQHADLSGMTNAQAYFVGDLTGDKADNFDDFVLFKKIYEAAHGAGSFSSMAAGVPEPSSLVLIILAGGMATFLGRRSGRLA